MQNSARTLSTAYQDMKRRFTLKNIDTAELDARILLQHVADISREDLILQANTTIQQKEYDLLQSCIQRRVAGEPVSRIIGKREFYGFDFELSKETLDPRPDTETLIATVLKYANTVDRNYRILDLGTGTGCIILTLLSQLPLATGTAIDISANAIETAVSNANYLGLNTRCQFLTIDWGQHDIIRDLGTFDIIVSNPPYIPSTDITKLSKEVRTFDPIRALDGGDDGLHCYKELMKVIPHMLSDTGFCVFEIGCDQAEDVTNILKNAGFTQSIVENDLAGRNRCIFTTK